MSTNPYVYDDEIKHIESVKFTIWGNNEIDETTVFGKGTSGVDIPELYDNMEAKRGSLVDPRLGVTSYNMDCATCGLGADLCIGHFGHIALAEPVFNIGYISYIKSILSCICIKCQKLLVYKNEEEITEMLRTKSKRMRLEEFKELSKSVKFCQAGEYGCGSPVYKIKSEINKKAGAINIFAEILDGKPESADERHKAGKIKHPLTPERCYNILKNMSDKDCEILGLDTKWSSPSDMIHTIFPVPPNQVRPSAKIETLGTSTMEDDLTKKLIEIVKNNIKIKKHNTSITEESMVHAMDQRHLMQLQIGTYQNSDVVSNPKSDGGKTIKSLATRMKAKEGRLRGNLMGKRVDHSARTVITPDPNLDLNQLGIPLEIAMNLTFPEVVTEYNISRLTELVHNGAFKYPGANFIFPRNSYDGKVSDKKISLKYNASIDRIILKKGDVVERHLQDGDYVLLNRQPSLHKLSMMGHRVKVSRNNKENTFRLNICVTKPYNADFDGDEMNIFAPQNIQTSMELEYLADVKRHIITPRTSGPIIGLVQDGVLGAGQLTKDDMRFKWKDAMNILSSTNLMDFSTFKKEEYTGRNLYSIILPEKINVDTNGITIINGEFISGRLSNKSIGDSRNSIIHYMWNEYGIEKTRKFIDDTQRIVNNFLMLNGATIGLKDAFITHDLKEQINKYIEMKKLEALHTLTNIENNPTTMESTLFEGSFKSELEIIRDGVSKIIMENLSDDNNFNIISGSGAKGSIVNIGQISGCLGQQSLENKRIQRRIKNRSLSYFHQFDDSPSSRGFITNNFLKGMDATEFIQANMAGREGLIDTAIKTAESGYVQRKLIKTTEDIVIAYDGTVRNSNGTIFQFSYGDSGADTTKQHRHSFISLEMGNGDVDSIYKFTKNEMKDFNVSDKQNNDFIKEFVEMRDELRKMVFKTTLTYVTFKTDFHIPINISKIITNSKYRKPSKVEKLDAPHIMKEINRVIATISPMGVNSISTMLLRYALYEMISPKRCLIEYGLGKQQFDGMITTIIDDYEKSMVEPGEMVGILSAQSIGEPTTQLTLNTFHSAGIGSKGIASIGVPRIKEIVSASEKIKTPIMTLYLENQHSENKHIAGKISSALSNITVNEIRDKVEFYYDPLPHKENSIMATDKATNVFKPNVETKYSCSSDVIRHPWLIRIKMNKEKMIENNVSLLDIKSKFCIFWKNRFNDTKGKKDNKKLFDKITSVVILSNDESDTIPYIHLRLAMVDYNYSVIIDFVDKVVDEFKISGVDGISDCDVEPKRNVFIGDDNKIEKRDIHVLTAIGNNPNIIRYMNGIDQNKSLNNDIISTYKKFGIEAARTLIIKELNVVFSENVVVQHLAILVDAMTNSGKVLSADRYGVIDAEAETFSKATFEQPVSCFYRSAVFGSVDHMNSVSSRIMGGMAFKGGTSMCNVILDTDMIINSEYTGGTKSRKFKEIKQDATMIDEDIHEDFIPIF